MVGAILYIFAYQPGDDLFSVIVIKKKVQIHALHRPLPSAMPKKLHEGLLSLSDV